MSVITINKLILVSQQSASRWLSHKPEGRLPLLPARPVATYQAKEHHCPMAGNQLYCLVTKAHRHK